MKKFYRQLLIALILGVVSGLCYAQYNTRRRVTINELLYMTLDKAGFLLLECKAFKEKWPKEHANLGRILSLAPPIIALSPRIGGYENGVFCASASFDQKVIFLENGFFGRKACGKPHNTFTHELLHIAGLPNHKRDLDIDTDAVYVMTKKCLGEQMEKEEREEREENEEETDKIGI